MEDVNHNIVIISDQALRAESLAKTIEIGFNNGFKVPIFKTDKVESIDSLSGPLLLLVDLMGTSQSSRQIILPLKEKDADIKIIALHLYRSSLLVNPLFTMGVDGYVYYEPSRDELVNAIRTVMSGKKYIPNYLLSA